MHPMPKRIASVLSPAESSVPLPERIDRLLEDQKRDWKALRNGYVQLQDARTRAVDCREFSVTLQFNPQRIASTSARTDEKSISSRKCFLCVENLPREQKGILVKDTFLILCNPAPIFERHLTVSHVEHRDQGIGSFVTTLLELAQSLSSSYTLFYNGPKSGASAPDHMHFQALPSYVLPVERDVETSGRRRLRRNVNSVSICTINDYGREVIVLESESSSELGEVIHRLINAMKKVLGIVHEPLLNVLCSFQQGRWKAFVFPRTKHRPDEFFLEGEEKLMVSPAAVDMAGFIVTPLQRDYDRIDAGIIRHVYRQVSPDATFVEKVLEVI